MKTDNNTTPATKPSYRFQTIVVSDNHRTEFTALRDKLDTTDKDLYLAMITLLQCNANLEADLGNVITGIKNERTAQRDAEKAKKLAEKADKAAEAKALKAAAKAALPPKEPKAPKAAKGVVVVLPADEPAADVVVEDAPDGESNSEPRQKALAKAAAAKRRK